MKWLAPYRRPDRRIAWSEWARYLGGMQEAGRLPSPAWWRPILVLERRKGPSMHPRTRNTLLGLGFDSELIDAIAKNHHTVDALRTLSKSALAQSYTSAQITVIQTKIVRQPIPEDMVTRVLNTAGSACCYCEDGLVVRPYQIHHVEPYSATQDHSEENLLAVCPNHHVWIHETKVSAAQQRHTRRKWHALVALAELYKAKGVGFPFGSFVSVDYVGHPSAVELIREIRVTPPTAVAVSGHPVADEVRGRVLNDRFALLLGRSGDGKTTLALGVAGQLARDRWHVFRYRPPTADNRLAFQEILGFIAIAAKDSVLVLDDANAWLTSNDLEEIAAVASGKAAVIATWTRERGGDDTRVETHLPNWVSAEWSKLSPSVMAFFVAHEVEVVHALRALEDPNATRRIGLGMFEEGLADRMRRYEKEAKTVAEFLFFLRGGSAVVRKELVELVERDRADLPVLYAAVEQIADFERPVTPAETAESLGKLSIDRTLPQPSAEWVTEVYEHERNRRRIQRRRDAYTTIHREWAKSLICAALGERKATQGIEVILSRDFDARTARPFRTMRLWSWLWYDHHGNPFVREWAASLTSDDWITFVSTAAAQSLDEVSFIADRMHLLFHWAKWDEMVAIVFDAIREPLARAVAGAGAESWGVLKSLFMALDHACPSVAAQVLQAWSPLSAAKALEGAHPDRFDSAWWFFSGVKKHSPAWVAEVGSRLDWDALRKSLGRVRPGDLNSIERCQSLLQTIGVPLTRSRLRQFVDVMVGCLSTSSLSELTPGLGLQFGLVLRLFPLETQRLAAAVDVGRFARELATSTPRNWRSVAELSSFIWPTTTDLYGRVIDELDKDLFTASVVRYGSLCPYELRCLVWFLTFAAKGEARKDLAARLAQTVKAGCVASASERGPLLQAMTELDEQIARDVASALPPQPEEKQVNQPNDDDDEDKAEDIERWWGRIQAAEATGDDYDVWAVIAPAGDSRNSRPDPPAASEPR